MELRTERLVLSPWTSDDAERLFDIRRRPDVAQWLGDPRPWADVSEAYDAITLWHLRLAPLGVWAIRPIGGGQPAGSVSLSHLPESEEYETGWYLHPDSTGNGYAAEAARRVLEHAFAHAIERVWAIMWPHNDASAKVAATAGMDDLGVRDDPWYGTDYEPTSRMFRLSNPKI